MNQHSRPKRGRRKRMARGRLPDRVRPGLEILFVGINPGRRSARVGHHYAGSANRFWPLLNRSGLLPDGLRLEPRHDGRLPGLGLGLTNLVARPVFVLPNPSGRNAGVSTARMLRVFRDLARMRRAGAGPRGMGAVCARRTPVRG